MTQAETELLPCPFCGSPPNRSFAHDESTIWCSKCLAASVTMEVTIDGETKPAAIAAWNRRTPPEVSAEGVSEEAGLPSFDDPAVQIVYEIIADNVESPDPEEHWEGYTARRIVAALRPSTPEVEEPRIKPLEWQGNGWPKIANCAVGQYQVFADFEVWWNGYIVPCDGISFESAKAAAQADYEARIRSALVPK